MFLMDLYTYSNTSHVLIYRMKVLVACEESQIQIHLMFLFIVQSQSNNCLHSSFKYISCSYLSYTLSHNISCFCIQIHLMFLFIRRTSERYRRYSKIQIHLMFLFIIFFWYSLLCTLPFKYISCSYLSKM